MEFSGRVTRATRTYRIEREIVRVQRTELVRRTTRNSVPKTIDRFDFRLPVKYKTYSRPLFRFTRFPLVYRRIDASLSRGANSSPVQAFSPQTRNLTQKVLCDEMGRKITFKRLEPLYMIVQTVWVFAAKLVADVL